MMIPDLTNIILAFAQVKKKDEDYLNRCNRCYKYKCEEMKNVDVIFYQIKLTFILDKLFNGASNSITPEFQEIIERSEIKLFEDQEPPQIIPHIIPKRSGWIANSIDIENYWFKLNNLITVQDIIMNRNDYLEFVNKNFEFLEERNINFCSKCWLDGKKIKLD